VFVADKNGNKVKKELCRCEEWGDRTFEMFNALSEEWESPRRNAESNNK
jgi:hypothetical protein